LEVIELTPKERTLASIAHTEPDRVPVGEWQFGPEIIEPVLGEENLYGCGLRTTNAYWDGRRDEIIEHWKQGLVKLTDHFQWDAVLLHMAIGKGTTVERPEQLSGTTWRDSSGNTLTYSRETDRVFITAKEARSASAPGASPPAPPDDEPSESELEVLRHVVRELGGSHFLFSAPLRGHPRLSYADASVSEVENWVRLYEDPDAYRDGLLNGITSESTRLGIADVKREGLNGVAWGCDFGCNTGPFMSPEMFRRAILPGLGALCEQVHEEGLVLLLHSCGNNRILMDLIVEAGVDVYQSIQPEMDICSLKRRYGKSIALWGGVPAGDLITRTPAEVREIARHHLEVCKPGGGYIFGTSHSVMPGAKYENYRSMLEAHRTCGGYD